jgi:phosphodiesterase/alkaline phosphatase D-like protein
VIRGYPPDPSRASPAAVLSATGSSCEPRTERSCEVGWTVAADEALLDVAASGTANSEKDRDLTVKVDFTGLEPDTTHYCFFPDPDAGRERPASLVHVHKVQRRLLQRDRQDGRTR